MAKLKKNSETLDVISASVGYESHFWQKAIALCDMLLPKLLSDEIRIAVPNEIKMKEVL